MPPDFLTPGTPAPDFEITAFYTKRRFSLKACAGTPVLLAFVGYNTRDQVQALSLAVRERYPGIEQVITANLVDLSYIPSLARRMAENRIVSALKEGIKQIPKEFPPYDYLILLPDWSGKVSRAYRVKDVSQQPALVMVDQDGLILGSYQGESPTQAALDLVAKAIGAS
jgi:hypothetical protein